MVVLKLERKLTMVRGFAGLMLGALLMVGAALPAYAATVKVTVGETAITDVQIAQRAKLFTLEGKSANTKAAMTELVRASSPSAMFDSAVCMSCTAVSCA